MASSDLELFAILGSRFADLSAKAVLTPECCRSVQLSLQLQDFYTQQQQALDNFLDFLVEMDRQRMDIVALKDKGQPTQQVPRPFSSAMDGDFCSLDIGEPPPFAFEAFQPGPFFLDRVVRWARMIKWPVNEDVPSGGGTSYGELIVNLLLITQKPLPRVISKGSNGYTEYGDPVACSDFLLLPWSMDEAVTLMIHTTYFLHKYFGFEIFPAHLKTKSKMLVAWGSRRMVSGFRSRPMLPWSECHQKIFSAVVGVGGWHKPHIPQVDTGFICGQNFERLEAKTLYANLRKLQKKGGN